MNHLIDENGDIIEGGEYSDRYRIPKISSKSILPDMLKIELPEEIKSKAEEVYKSMGSPVRKDTERKRMVFCCVLFAYAELDIIHSPRRLVDIIGINLADFPRCINKYSMSKVNYHPPQRFYSVTDYIIFLGKNLNVDSNLIKFMTRCSAVMESREAVMDKPPDVLAAGIILYIVRTFDPDNYDGMLKNINNYVFCSAKSLTEAENKAREIDNR
jgi:hypothetical protein